MEKNRFLEKKKVNAPFLQSLIKRKTFIPWFSYLGLNLNTKATEDA